MTLDPTANVQTRPRRKTTTRKAAKTGWTMRLASVGVVAMGGLLLGGLHQLQRADAHAGSQLSTTASTVLPPRPTWIPVNRPIQLFALAGSEFSKLPPGYRAQRLTDDSQRRDDLSFGDFDPSSPYLLVSVLRSGQERGTQTFFLATARLAADQGLAITRDGQPTTLVTRFGPFAVADLTVSAGPAQQRACLAFRLDDQQPSGPVSISGLACGTPNRPMDRTALACVLDRLDLVSAGDDRELRSFFVDAERRRGQTCGGSRFSALGARNTWLDGEGVAPPLKR